MHSVEEELTSGTSHKVYFKILSQKQDQFHVCGTLSSRQNLYPSIHIAIVYTLSVVRLCLKLQPLSGDSLSPSGQWVKHDLACIVGSGATLFWVSRALLHHRNPFVSLIAQCTVISCLNHWSLFIHPNTLDVDDIHSWYHIVFNDTRIVRVHGLVIRLIRSHVTKVVLPKSIWLRNVPVHAKSRYFANNHNLLKTKLYILQNAKHIQKEYN